MEIVLGPRISFKDVLTSIMYILKRKDYRRLCGSVYFSIFTEEILKNKRYISCVSVEQFKGK